LSDYGISYYFESPFERLILKNLRKAQPKSRRDSTTIAVSETYGNENDETKTEPVPGFNFI